jgi:hypothetical protein
MCVCSVTLTVVLALNWVFVILVQMAHARESIDVSHVPPLNSLGVTHVKTVTIIVYHAQTQMEYVSSVNQHLLYLMITSVCVQTVNSSIQTHRHVIHVTLTV